MHRNIKSASTKSERPAPQTRSSPVQRSHQRRVNTTSYKLTQHRRSQRVGTPGTPSTFSRVADAVRCIVKNDQPGEALIKLGTFADANDVKAFSTAPPSPRDLSTASRTTVPATASGACRSTSLWSSSKTTPRTSFARCSPRTSPAPRSRPYVASSPRSTIPRAQAPLAKQVAWQALSQGGASEHHSPRPPLCQDPRGGPRVGIRSSQPDGLASKLRVHLS